MKVIVLGLFLSLGSFAQASVMAIVNGITVRPVINSDGEYTLRSLAVSNTQQKSYKICTTAVDIESTRETLAQFQSGRFTIELATDFKTTCIAKALLETNF